MAQQSVNSAPPRHQWTDRQRQVLDLIAARHTNGEIAEKLGFSFAAAKWHVSELITILGVDTREEVAAYWRAERGLRGRVRRPFRAIAALGAWKLAAGAAGVAAAAAGVVVGAAAIGSAGVPAAVVASAPTGTAVLATPTPVPTPVIGEVSPGFALPSLNDPSVEIRPPVRQPFVLAFVASWCAPCQQNLPIFESLHDATGVEVILVDTHDSGAATGWLADTNIALPIANDASTTVADSYLVSVGLPATYFVDADGRLRTYDLGALTPGSSAGSSLEAAMASIGVPYNSVAAATVSPS